MISDERVMKLYEDAIGKEMKGKFGNYEIPRKLILMSEAFSVEMRLAENKRSEVRSASGIILIA